MKKGLTLLEVLIVLTIAIITITFFIKVINRNEYDGGYDDWFVDPAYQNMRSQRKMADELQRQNDLKERELEMLKTPERDR